MGRINDTLVYYLEKSAKKQVVIWFGGLRGDSFRSLLVTGKNGADFISERLPFLLRHTNLFPPTSNVSARGIYAIGERI